MNRCLLVEEEPLCARDLEVTVSRAARMLGDLLGDQRGGDTDGGSPSTTHANVREQLAATALNIHLSHDLR